jgi:hypothetical protein
MNARHSDHSSSSSTEPHLSSPDGEVRDKLVVITGANSGLGLESSKRLARRRDRVGSGGTGIYREATRAYGR